MLMPSDEGNVGWWSGANVGKWCFCNGLFGCYSRMKLCALDMLCRLVKYYFICLFTMWKHSHFVFFVTFRVRWIWPWNFIYRWGKLRSTFMIFFQNFLKYFLVGLHQNLVCTRYVPIHIYARVIWVAKVVLKFGDRIHSRHKRIF